MIGEVETPPSAESRAKLHQLLLDKNLYSKGPEEFDTQFANDSSRAKLYELMVKNNLYSKSPEEFDNQFFQDLKKKDVSGPPVLPGEVDMSKWAETHSQTGSPESQIASTPNELKIAPPQQEDQALIPTDQPQNTPGMALPPEKPLAFDRPAPNPLKESVDYYTALRSDQHLRRGLGIDETPISAKEHGAHIAGQFNHAVVDMFSSFPKAVAIGAQALDRITGDDKPIEDYATFKAGKWLDEKALQIGVTATNPKLDDSFWESTIPSAFGSVLGLILTGGGSASETAGLKLLNASPKLAPAAMEATKELGGLMTSNLAISAGLTQGVQEFEQAKQSGASDKDAFGVFLKNYGVGLTEVVPIAHALERINQFTKGGLIKTLANVAIAGGKGALEEGTQEGVQQYLTNKIAQGTYDPKREGFKDMISSIGAGAFVGFMLPGIMTAMEHMTPEQKLETKQIIHDALLNTKPEETIKTPHGDLGKVETKTPKNEKPKEQTPPVSTTEPATTVPKAPKEKPLPVQAANAQEVPDNTQKEADFVKALITKGVPIVAAQGTAKTLIKALTDKDSALKLLHTGNKIARDLWTKETGVELPNTEGGTQQAINDYFNKGSKPTIAEIAKTDFGKEHIIIAKVPGTEPETFGKGFKVIGKNSDGDLVGEDSNGVRAVKKGNIVISQPVGMVPTKSGMQIQVNNPEGEFMTVEEGQKAKPKTEVKKEITTRSQEEIGRIMNVRLPKDMYGKQVKVKVVNSSGVERTEEIHAEVMIANLKNRLGLKKAKDGKSPMEELIDCIGGKK